MRWLREQRARWFRLGPARSLTIAIVVELFCGTGHFAKAMEEHRPVLRWDILMGPDYDLTKHSVQILFFGWLRAGWVCAVWMGTPCNSFSKARNQPGGPAALRDKDHFNGLLDMRPCAVTAVRLGHLLARFSARVFVLCCLFLLPVVIENHHTSWLWEFPPMRRLLSRRDSTFTITELCGWQKLPFRRSTGFASANIDMSAIGNIRCLGAARGCCKFTNKPHQPL